MSFKKTLLIILLSSVSMFHADNIVAQPMINQEQISSMMNYMYDLMMPEFKAIYKKHFDEIEWLEHFYCMNKEAGDALIIIISKEFTDALASKIDSLVDIAFAEMSDIEDISVSAQQKAMFCNMMMEIMPSIMVQSLQKNAELKSSIYQEIVAEESIL